MSGFPTDPVVNNALLLFDSHSELISTCTAVQFCTALEEHAEYSLAVSPSGPGSQSFPVLGRVLYQTRINVLPAILGNLQLDTVNGGRVAIRQGIPVLDPGESGLFREWAKNWKQALKRCFDSQSTVFLGREFIIQYSALFLIWHFSPLKLCSPLCSHCIHTHTHTHTIMHVCVLYI